jgi:alanine-synthesizing transaminase
VPAQHAVQAALGGPRDINQLILPGGRLRAQRDLTYDLLSQIEGIDCVKPSGALYCFPRFDREVFGIDDDEQFVIDLVREQHVLVVHGRGFNWPEPDHFRIVTLPHVEQLEDAIGRISTFLDARRR